MGRDTARRSTLSLSDAGFAPQPSTECDSSDCKGTPALRLSVQGEYQFIYLSFYLSIYIYISLSISIYRSIRLSIYLTIYLSIYLFIYLSLMCLRPHMRTLWPNVNFAIFQLGRLLMENSRKYTSLSGSLS